jgi:hypothetical protein
MRNNHDSNRSVNVYVRRSELLWSAVNGGAE